MVIFIDESGIFANPAKKPNAVSCVAALVVPESALPQVIRDFSMIADNWTDISDELKGRRLDERRIGKIVTMLGNHPVLLVIVAIDMGVHSEPAITNHKLNQKATIIRGAALEHSAESRQQVTELGERIGALSNPLYVQSVILMKAASAILQTATFYYSQTDPATLGAFTWRIDAKGRELTEYEDLWSFTVKPFLDFTTRRNPTLFLKDADYSAYKSSFAVPEAGSSDFPKLFSVNRIMDSDRCFCDSREEPGIRLADVLANAFQRACNNKLQKRGWDRLGRLMIKHPTTKRAVSMVSLQEDSAAQHLIEPEPYASLLAHIEDTARPCLVESSQRLRPKRLVRYRQRPSPKKHSGER